MLFKTAAVLSISVNLCCTLYAAQPQQHLIAEAKTNIPGIAQYVARFTNNNTGDFYYGDLASGTPYGNDTSIVLNLKQQFGFFVIQPKFGIKHSVIIAIGKGGDQKGSA